MSTNAIILSGYHIAYSADDITYINVAETKSFKMQDFKIDEIDVTNSDSSGSFREYIFGLGDPGSFSFTFNYFETLFNTLYGFLRANKYWKITFSDSSYLKGTGYITALAIDGNDIGKELTCDCSVRWIGKPTFTVV